MPVSVTPALPDRIDDIRTAVRAAVEQAMVGRDLTVVELQRRVDDLERRLQAPPVVAPVSPAPQPAAPLPTAPQLAPSAPFVSAPAARAVPSFIQSSPAARAPAIDVAAIERQVSLDPEMRMFDGRRRRARLLVASAFALCVTFAGLFAALAQSYSHAHP